MLGAVAIDFLPGMDESAPKRGVPPVSATGPLPSAASSFDLVLRANAGDSDALEALCARYTPRLQRWAHGRIPPAARGALQTHDLVQDTLMRVVERLPSFEPATKAPFRRTCGQRCGTAFETSRGSINGLGRQTRWIAEIAGKEDSPLDLAIGHETLERYEAALERLRPRRRNSSSRASRWACRTRKSP